MANSRGKCTNCKKLFPNNQLIMANVGKFCGDTCRKDYALNGGIQKALERVRKEERKKIRTASAKFKKERKEERADLKKRKKEVKPMKEWYDHLQALVNQWIVHVRDKNKPCCTCGTENPNILYAAGHYRSRGACPELRFELTNIHKQCNVQCNQIKSGARAEYREFIAYNYGPGHLNWLDGHHKPLKERFEDWQDVEKEIKRYRKLIREAGLTPCR